MNTMVMKIATWTICLLFIVGLTPNGIGDVLCIGDNGHIQLEFVSQQCCEEIGESSLLIAFSTERDHHDTCGNCLDLPLDGPAWHGQNSELINKVSILHPQVLFSSTHNIDRTNQNFVYFGFRLSSPDHNLSSTILATTIILC